MSSVPTKTALSRLIKEQNRSMRQYETNQRNRYDFTSVKKIKRESAVTSPAERSLAENSACTSHNENISSAAQNENITSTPKNASIANPPHNENIANPPHNENIANPPHNEELDNVSKAESITYGEQPISAENIYYSQIINKRLFRVEERFMVVADFASITQTCKENYCISICRRPISFSGNVKYIYTCQCQPDPNVFSLAENVNQHFDEYDAYVKPCFHISLARKLWQFYDIESKLDTGVEDDSCGSLLDHFYAENSHKVKCDVYPLFCKKIVAVSDITGQKLAYVGIRVVGTDLKLKCSSCRALNCWHVKGKEDIIIEILKEQGLNKQKRYDPKCLSKNIIEFDREDLPVTFSRPLMEKFIFEDDNLHIVPREIFYEDCSHCNGQYNKADPKENKWIAQTVRVISKNETLNGKVYYRPCVKCDNILIYDGKEDGMLNMSSYLVSYDLLRSIMHSFIAGKRPLYTYYHCWVEELKDLGIECAPLTYDELRLAWQNFLKLIKIDDKAFSCSLCTPSENSVPPIIICDGTAVSFQKRMLTVHHQITADNSSVYHGSRHKQRVFIKHKHIRLLLRRYVYGGRPDLEILSCKEYEELLSELKNNDYMSLYQLLNDISLHKAPKTISGIIGALSCNVPICAILKVDGHNEKLILSLCQEKEVSKNPTLMSALLKIPLLHEYYSQGCTDNISNLLVDMWNVACEVYRNCNSIPHIDINKEDSHLSCFPKLPAIRGRGCFKMDNQKSTRVCNKKSLGHPSLLPGIFTMFCPHGICFGFQVMFNHESPNIPFTILRTRFQTAPSWVIYDNACSLHAYAMNRDPIFFKNTQFLIDRLHWFNHRGCCEGYCLDKYFYLRDVNTQVNEQANAGIKRIKDQLSYMSEKNFMLHIKFYLWAKNKLKQTQKM